MVGIMVRDALGNARNSEEFMARDVAKLDIKGQQPFVYLENSLLKDTQILELSIVKVYVSIRTVSFVAIPIIQLTVIMYNILLIFPRFT